MAGHYNGFTPRQRAVGGAAVNQAWKAGRLKRPTVCEACGATEQVQAHNENYATPLDYYAVCFVCHMMIHCRYRGRDRWLWYLEELHNGAEFERVRDWITFRSLYLQNADLRDRIVDAGPPRPESFLDFLPLEPTGAVPPDLPPPVRLQLP